MKRKPKRINNLVVVSDTHCGCRLGLCPPEAIPLDGGGYYKASRHQLAIWKKWKEFWFKWVPMATHGEPFAVVVNGDALDGVHHNATTQISHNLNDQATIARLAFKPVVELCGEMLYWVTGTPVHSGESGVDEDRLAKELGAIPDKDGRYARYELWARTGKGLCHFAHHIGTCGSAHYESSAVMRELAESYAEAGRNQLDPPDVVVRSHRHRNIEVRVPTKLGYGISFVTPGWQLRTPFAYRVAGGRITTPQIGGSLIRQGDNDLYTRHRVWNIGRNEEEVI